MTEKEKKDLGYLYKDYDEELMRDLIKCKDLCHKINKLKPSKIKAKQKLFKKLFNHVGDNVSITSPFYCDYGYNISVGDNFYANHNLVILDCTKITIGNNVFIGPDCLFSAAEHPIDFEQRNKGLEIALPITIGNNVWIGGKTTIIAGVSIGDNSVIGAGSVVTKDIPPNVVAFGNPCKVFRNINENDKNKYPKY